MVGYGRVIGGHYLNAPVSVLGSLLVVQAGVRWRKLDEKQVVAWQEILPESKSGVASAVGKAVAGAALPGFVGRTASAAVGATLETMRPARTVRVDWVDGKQSLVKLPDKLFTHLEMMLASRGIAAKPLPIKAETAPPETSPSLPEQALNHLAAIVKDRLPGRASTAPEALGSTHSAQPDVTEQLTKLAALRDAGVLTEDEFSTKKAELLGRI